MKLGMNSISLRNTQFPCF